MPTHIPFNIEHIALDQLTQSLKLPVAQHGYYLVFWYKTIPLGELYLDAGELPGAEQLNKEIITAIKPTVDFYVRQFALPPARYPQHFIASDNAALLNTLEAINQKLDTNNLPQIVPVSVVICTRNRSRQLKTCLHSLQNLPCRPEEIIVVDNAPSDNSTAEVVAQFDNVIYCKEPRPGLDVARNAGAYKASCAIIAYTDDDVVIHPLWVFRTWQTFLNERVDAMTGLVITAALDTEAQYIFEKYWSFNRGYIDKMYDTAYFKATGKPEVWEIGAGANMAFRKSALEASGYFDERLDVGAAGCNGDSEMWYRILAHGFTIQYNPRAVVYHQHRPELKALKKQLFSYMRGHVVAALIQQTQNEKANYRQYVYRGLPKYYLTLLKKGFPNYTYRYSTLWSEIRGLVSGIRYYKKHRYQPAKSTQHRDK